MLSQKNVIKRLQEYAKQIKESGIHIRRVVLYGSYSRNEQHEYSDIDVAFVADEFISVPPEDVKLISRVLIQRPYLDIQPRTYNTKDFTPDRDPFVEEYCGQALR